MPPSLASTPAPPGPLVARHCGPWVCWIDPAQWAALGLACDAPAVGRLIGSLLGAIGDKRARAHKLKDDRRSVAWRVQTTGGQWVVKRRRQSPVKALLYHLARGSASWREWRGARRLAAEGVATRQPLALVFDRRWGRWSETLVLPYLDVPSLDALIVAGGRASPAWRDADPAPVDPELLAAACDPRRRRALARTLGLQIGRLTAAGWINVDHKPTNLMLIAGVLDARAEPVIIDTTAVVRRRGGGRVERMFYNLLRAARRVGPIDPREALACLKAACQADATLAPGGWRARKGLARRVQDRLDVFYATHDAHSMAPLPPEEIARRAAAAAATPRPR